MTHGPSQRQLKVGETVRHALSDVFIREEIYNPNDYSEIKLTVSEVRISPDLRNATVFIMPLGGKNQDEVVAVVNHLAPQLRHQLSKRVALKRLPNLFFKLDDSFNQAGHINDLLNDPKVKQDVERG